jgi:hypothetical protein
MSPEVESLLVTQVELDCDKFCKYLQSQLPLHGIQILYGFGWVKRAMQNFEDRHGKNKSLAFLMDFDPTREYTLPRLIDLV